MATDNSFMFQAHTKIITNPSDPTIQGTVNRGFAVRTKTSPIVQIELDDSIPASPNIFIYVDKVLRPEKNIMGNTNFILNLPNSAKPSVLITGTKNGVMSVFDNGFTLEVVLKKLNGLTWLEMATNFDNSVKNYANALTGIMGNFNGKKDDDILNRDTNNVQSSRSESVYFADIESCKLFLNTSFSIIISLNCVF